MRAIARLGFALSLAAAAGGLVGPAPAGLAWAQAPPDDEDADDGALVPRAQNVFVLDANQFNQWVFNNHGEPPTRARFESVLALRVDEIDRACGLSDAQKAKLRLAGRGDIARFFDRVDAKRREVQGKQFDQNKLGEAFQRVQPLQASYNAGLFEDGSLFAKALAGLLDAGQADRQAAAARERLEFRYKAKVDLAVATNARSLGLTAEQRAKFAEVLLKETLPPRSFGQHESYVVMLQAAKLPEEKLKPIFTDAQWRVLQRQLAQAKGVEQALLRAGYIPAGGAPGADDEGEKDE